jgi:hypothetical protein
VGVLLPGPYLLAFIYNDMYDAISYSSDTLHCLFLSNKVLHGSW